MFESNSQSTRLSFLEKPAPVPTTSGYNPAGASRGKTAVHMEKFESWVTRKDVQSTSRVSQDITEIDYSQFKNKLVERKHHNSTFQKRDNIIVPGNGISG